MERRIRSRIAVLILLIGAFVGLFSLRIYKLQTAEEAKQPDSLTYYTTVEAARGQILDRNGTVLVTNRASYDIVIISYVWRNGPSPNESLMELLDTCDELGLDIVHQSATGKLHTLICRGSAEEVTGRLQTVSPLFMLTTVMPFSSVMVRGESFLCDCISTRLFVGLVAES